jgi:hypothetical protein
MSSDIYHNYDSNNNGTRIMNDKTLLSSFLPRLLEEYKEKLRPDNADFPLAESCQRRKRSEQLPPSFGSPSKGKFSVVSDNARMPTAPLRKRSASYYSSGDDEVDMRDNSVCEHDDDDESRFESSYDFESESFMHSSFPPPFRRSKSFHVRRPHVDKLQQDHKLQRWSPHGMSLSSTIQPLRTPRFSGATDACVDVLPKRYARRPSL